MSDTHLHSKPEGGLLQSLHWADVCRTRGKRVITLAGSRYGVIESLPLVGDYLYVPRFAGDAHALAEIASVAHEQGMAWVRLDLTSEAQVDELAAQTQLRDAPHDMQPANHLIMDLTSSEEDLLGAMKSKTRYNIRLADKKGVVVHCVTVSDEDFPAMLDIFYEMVCATGRRKGVQFHPRQYYQAMFECLPEEMIALFVAEVDGGVFLAANIVTFYGDTVTYLHGATGEMHRNYMAPFALQWAAMKAAKARGFHFYDFGGVYPESKDRGKKGITDFKRGFSPKQEVARFAGSYDVILSPLRYTLYQLLQKIKSLR